MGASSQQITRRIASGYLTPVAPGVYAVGHVAPSVEADLWSAVLYAGPGAALSHGTAGWWRGWLGRPPARIQVATPRQVLDHGEISVHARRRELGRELVNGIPVTTVPQTLLDIAATESEVAVRMALAQLDYAGGFGAAQKQAIATMCLRRRPGGARLRAALSRHMPELARCRSGGEVMFLVLFEEWDIPCPLVNRRVFGVRPDFYWPQFRLAAYLDGCRGHRSPEQLRKDHEDDLVLRRHSVLPVRYAWAQAAERPLTVRDDLRVQMAARG